jgi:hypothetical protein
LSTCVASRRLWNEADKRSSGNTFSRPGLAYKTEGLALIDVEAHAIDGVDQAALRRELNMKVA